MRGRTVSSFAFFVLAIIFTAVYIQRLLAWQSSRESLRAKIAPLSAAETEHSNREIAQIVHLIELDVPRRRPALRTSEQEKLSRLLPLLRAWEYFASQITPCKRIGPSDRARLTAAGLARDPEILMSPELAQQLQLAAKARVYSQFLEAGTISRDQLLELGAIRETLKSPTPQPSTDFYSPLYCQGRLAGIIAPLAAELAADLEHRRWF